MTTRPRVYTRIRPLNNKELDAGATRCLYSEKGHPDTLCFDNKDNDQMKTRFDHVFDEDRNQDDIFNHVGTEVMSTLFSGYNASIFAYGQTGSGKTHTMEGGKEDPATRGLIPRLIEAIFNKFANGRDISNYSVHMSFVQIYQEKIQDLFNNTKQLEIHMDRTGQYIAQGATWNQIKACDEALDLYTESVKKRATSATEMNLVSSRSHTILMLKLQWDEPHLPGSKAQLNLIDLAGSEKLYQSGATGETMKEAIHINKSLSALGNVVSKLVDAVTANKKGVKVHIPYKDSKLTYLLQSSLGGGNLVHFILALSSSNQWKAESSSTIDFGKRALKLVIKPVRNPIDYKRLAEMEAMIEKMRNHIRSLEDELENKQVSDTNAGFLRINQLHQEGEEKQKAKRVKRNNTKATLKNKTELNRIMANLPETLEDLTSHCVLHPSAKVEFRQLGGIEKLVHFIDKSPSTFHRAHAAHTLAHVMDDEGRDEFGEKGGMDALSRLLQVKEERCKEAACVAFEVVVRNHDTNKRCLPKDCYKLLTELIYGYPNQQVQEAACTAVASIVDTFPEAKQTFSQLQIVQKLLKTIQDAPEEVVHVTKAAATCLGRLAHGDNKMQREIADMNGVDIIINDVLFSPAGDRDHQVPIMASYALVNLCCSNSNNMSIVRRHGDYPEIRSKLMEGLARAFGTNTMREGFGRATAEEAAGPFPYFGVTVMDEWTKLTCGGRPIFSTFMENPQFYLYVNQDVQLSMLIQDVLYESRMQQKQRNNTVYMGLAIFQGDTDLTKSGLKQLDFHGKMQEIAKFTSNCENVLHCTLKKSETPYIVVPFTSQRGRTSKFTLSAFADKPVELTQIPETTGWVRHVVEGSWTDLTGRCGEGFDWRNNPQVRIRAKENANLVFVLSYLSLDQQRSGKRMEEGSEEEKQNTRPRLHGRVFKNQFHAGKRYLKALVPLPQNSPFVGSNAFSSNSYITTTVALQGGQDYVYIPFTEIPYQDTWRLCVYSDVDEVEVATLSSKAGEWHQQSFAGQWTGKPLSLKVKAKGKICAIANSKETFLRVSVIDDDGNRLTGIDAFWNGEGHVEHTVDAKDQRSTILIEGMVKKNGSQQPAEGNKFDLFVFTEQEATIEDMNFASKPSSIELVGPSKTDDALSYPMVGLTDDIEIVDSESGDEFDSDEDNAVANAAIERAEQLEAEVNRQKEENERLKKELAQKDEVVHILERKATLPQQPPSRQSSVTGRQVLTRTGSRQGGRSSLGGIAGKSAIMNSAARSNYDTQKAMDDVGLRLGQLAGRDKPPNAAEWMKMKKELHDLQQKLASNRPPTA